MKKIALFVIISVGMTAYLYSADLVHVVRKGETLYSLARSYDVSVDDIIRANKIGDPSALSIGMEITIPSVYIVEKGDTYYSLAKRFEISVDELCRLNNADDPGVLVIGERILIPGTVKEEVSAHSDVAGQEEAGESTAPEVREVPEAGSKPNFWPHDGPSSRLTGKLEGMQFEGKDGDTIRSVSNGKVVWVGPYRGYNKIVFVQTMDDYIYGYGGNNDILVKVGDRVEPGTELGRLGINPHEGKARMFFFVYREGAAIDPYSAPRE